jgi:hypothetical protein
LILSIPSYKDIAVVPHLFLVVLGGRIKLCNIELHDVRFVVGESIEATYPELKRQWFGLSQGLHLDAYMSVQCIDGFRVKISREVPSKNVNRLWFVNMGAYRADSLAELHHFGLLVAPSAQAAKARAKQRWLKKFLHQHKDDLCAVDNCVAVEKFQSETACDWYVQLEPHPDGLSQAQVPDWFGYRLI